MIITYDQLMIYLLNEYELNIDKYHELMDKYMWEPEVYCGDGLYYEVFPEDKDYLEVCNYYGYNPNEQEIIEIENEFYQYYIINKESADNLKEYTNETVFYYPTENIYIWACPVMLEPFLPKRLKLKKDFPRLLNR